MTTFRVEEIIEDKKYRIWLSVGWIKGKRPRPTETFYGTKKKAEVRAAKFLAEYESRSGIDPTKTKLKDFLDSWLEDWQIENDLAPGSYRAYKSRIDNHIKEEIGDVYLSKLEPLHINQLRNTVLKKGLGRTTVSLILAVLNTALSYAYSYKMIAENPMQFLKQSRRKGGKQSKAEARKKVKALEQKDMDLLLEMAKGHFLYPIIYVAAFTGMRVAELCGLLWTEVVFSKKSDMNYIKVRQQIQKDKEGVWGRCNTKSANGVRDIGIDEDVANFLRKLKEKCTCEYVFEHRGTFRKPNSVSSYFGELMKELNIEGVNFHMLRHTHASLLLAEGYSITGVANRLGDTVTEIQRTYAHFFPNKIHEPARVFASIMKKGKSKENNFMTNANN